MWMLRSMNPARCLRVALAILVITSLAMAVVSAGAVGLARDTTKRVSVATDGSQATGDSSGAAISANGRYVAFYSDATNLVSGDTNSKWDIFVHNTQTGATERVSVTSNGSQATGNSYAPTISPDGRYVAFYSYATNLVSGDTNGNGDVFVHDRQTGDTERLSVATGGSQGTGGNSYTPAISPDGRYVAFYSYATDLVSGDTNGSADAFVHDRQTGATERLSVATGGNQATGDSYDPVISPDGRYVAFYSYATDLVSGDTNGYVDVFVHDRQTGATERLSVATGGSQGTGGDSQDPAISADGRYVTFYSYATNLVSGDTNGNGDVFVHDRQTGVTERVSVTTGGSQGTGGDSAGPAISADGRYVTLHSSATDLVSDDTNGYADVFTHDRQTGVTERVSVTTGGSQGAGGDSQDPAISADGRHVAFHSSATDLISGDTNGRQDIFARNILPADATYIAVAGATRYETAVEASKDAFPNGADTVVIATGANWPDALGGAALAGALEGPILLTPTSGLPQTVMDEIDRLGASDAVILGGEGAVSADAALQLITELGTGHVKRYGGANRYATADLIAAAVADELGDAYNGTCFVTTGLNFPDALAGSPLAAAQGWPIFLAPASGPTANTLGVMASINVTDVIILGGTGVVPPAIEDALEATHGADHVTRLGGATRYETAVEVATYGVDSAWMRWDGIALATGQNFPDALAGGVLQGQMGSVMLLTHSTSLIPVTADVLTDKKDDIGEVRYLGGVGALSQGVRDSVETIVQ